MKTNNLKPFLTKALILTLGVIGLINIISEALPAIQIIQTPEIEAINLDTKKEIKETIENLNKVDPQKPTTTKLNKKSKGEITSENKNSNLKVSIKSDRTISMDNGRNKINLKVSTQGENKKEETKLVDNKVIFQGIKVDTIVESIDGGIRQTISIKDPTAPKVYNFPMELQPDQKIVINKDGSANVINSKNELITTILKPWARDANNKELKTFYTVDKIDKNVLQQHIVTNDMTRYPVKADPTWCGSQIEYSRWKDITGIYQGKNDWSMNIRLNWCGRTTASAGCRIFNFGLCMIGSFGGGWDAWATAYDMAGSHNRFKDRYYGSSNYWKMYHQFICHYANPKTWFKDEYNIDPWRHNVGQVKTYVYGCNPPIDRNY